MSLTLKDIERLAHLSRLELSPQEAEQTQQKLNALFALVDQIQAVDTSNIEPLAHPLEHIQDITQRLREDVVSEVIDPKANQQCAPSVKDGLYLVPKVVE